MKKITLAILTIAIVFSLTSCQQDKKTETDKTGKTEITENKKTEQVTKTDSVKTESFAPQSVNDELADKIKEYITTKFINESDLKTLTQEDRKFQIYQIDLNDDGNNEIFVNFITPYFCGTGGCTILLLSDELKLITKFTVTRTPLYAEKEIKNGWKILLTRSGGELKELVYSKGKYPSNPSVVAKAPYDAPSGHAEIMFDEEYSKAKTYEF